MELLGIRQARVIVYVPLPEINPHGRALIPGVVLALIERYGFLGYPQKQADYDETKGVTFTDGRWNDIAIDRLILYGNGILVDTRSSTDDSEAMLIDTLTWASESFGLTYRPDMLTHKVYYSEVIFRSETLLSALNPKLDSLAARLTEVMKPPFGEKLVFETASVGLGYDSLLTKLSLSPFRVERLVDTPFGDQKYWSTAPLPTKTHLEFLEEFEAILKG
jgi:hypothetical protein